LREGKSGRKTGVRGRVGNVVRDARIVSGPGRIALVVEALGRAVDGVRRRRARLAHPHAGIAAADVPDRSPIVLVGAARAQVAETVERLESVHFFPITVLERGRGR
jgi:hypothetical protein